MKELPFISRRHDGEAAFEAQEWFFVELIRSVRYQNSQAEGESCSYAVSPVCEMHRLAETSKPSFARVEDQKVDELVEEIEAVGDPSQVDDRRRQVFRREAEQAEEEQQRSHQHKRPANRRLQHG